MGSDRAPLTPKNANKKFSKLPTEQWGCDFKAIPEEIVVSGREGYNETMNGIYTKGASLHEGRPYYKHASRKFVIRWCPVKGSWFFDWRGLNTDTTASAALSEDVASPHLAQSAWRVYDGTKWISDAKLSLSTATEKLAREEFVIEEVVEGADAGGVSV